MKTRLLVTAITAAALTLTGCSTTPEPKATTEQAATQQPAPTQEPTPTPTPTQEPTPTPTEASWNTFTSDDGYFTFEYPANWTVEDTHPASIDGEIKTKLLIRDEHEETVATLGSGGGGVGGVCEKSYPVTVLDVEELNLPHDPPPESQPNVITHSYRYTVIEYPTGVSATMGIGGESLPESCRVYNIFSAPYGDPHFLMNFSDQTLGAVEGKTSPLIPLFANIEEAKAFMDTDDYKNLKRMFTSLVITPQ